MIFNLKFEILIAKICIIITPICCLSYLANCLNLKEAIEENFVAKTLQILSGNSS